MRIATYNLWNSATNWSQRLAAAAEELGALSADIVCVQEAPVWASPTMRLDRYLQERTGHTYVAYERYPEAPRGEDRPEGLAVLTTLPVALGQLSWGDGADNENSWGMRITVPWEGLRLGVTNVHLDWRQAANRDRQIVRIVRDLCNSHPADLDILCGDFNADGDAACLAFLRGEIEADSYRTRWRDLALEWHIERGEQPPVTLDFEHNPRWKAKRITAPSRRVDRIYLRINRPDIAVRVQGVGLFGKVPRNSLGIVPSDHYGVHADLDLG